MSNCLRIHDNQDDFVVAENLDYVEDSLVEVCEKMRGEGVHLLEIASALIFVTHYMLSKETREDAQKYYRFLTRQCATQVEALHEFYELPSPQQEQS